MKKILFATSELYPLIKTGGLADVSYSLPIALSDKGFDVRVIIPGYDSVLEQVEQPTEVCLINGFMIPEGSRLLESTLPNSNVSLWIVDCPQYFRREGGPYLDSYKQEWPDNAHRFTMFCRAIVDVATGNTSYTWQPDVVHANDWQTGLVPAFLKLADQPPASVFTIHNLACQGNFSKQIFDELLLPQDWWHLDKVEFYDKMSFLKAGVVFADQISTVSPTYANEVLQPEFGYGMDGLLRHYSYKLRGILNGVDYDTWSPEQDPFLTFKYGLERLDEKINNKLDLQRKLGLKLSKGVPLFGIVSRLAHQKGIDYVIEAIRRTATEKIQWVILGSGEAEFETALHQLSQDLPEKVAFIQGYDEQMAHRIEAGVDIFVMASRYEPCGLNQIYSLKYGTLPLVRNTGGLADTVVDIDEESLQAGQSTGFVFQDPNADALVDTILRATTYYRKKKRWRKAQQNAMLQDFSWNSSAEGYGELFAAALNLISSDAHQEPVTG